MVSPDSVRLGWAVRSLRKRRRLTIETLALDSNMHPTYLSGIERGVRNPTWAKLRDLADTLGISVAALAEEAEQARCPECGQGNGDASATG